MHKKTLNAKDKLYIAIRMEMRYVIKKIAWDAFKNTGDINTFLEFKQIESIEKGIQEIQEIQKITNINVQNNNDQI